MAPSKQTETRELSRKEHSRRRRDEDRNRQALIGLAVVAALVVVLIAAGIGAFTMRDIDERGMRAVIAEALDRLLAAATQEFNGMKTFRPAAEELTAFLFDRLRGMLREQGYSANEVESVVAPAPERIRAVA